MQKKQVYPKLTQRVSDALTGENCLFSENNANDPQIVGTVGRQKRTIAGINGGSFSGPLLHGHVLPGGADWVLVGSDGSMNTDVRTTLPTGEGTLIFLKC